MDTFRILHLSDFHFSAEPGTVNLVDRLRSRGTPPSVSSQHVRLFKLTSHDENLAEAVAQCAWREGPQVDLTLVTGDVATTGRREDLDAAHRFITSPAAHKWKTHDGRPTLQGGGNPIVLLPGNHDRYGPHRWSAGDLTFDSVFHEYWKNGRSRQLVQLHHKKTGERLAIIAADFCLFNNGDADKGRYAYLGQGKAYEHLVGHLKHLTTRIRSNADPPVAVVWAVHFAPRYAKLESELRLIDDGALLDAAVEAEIGHIFCGHTHFANVYKPKGYPSVSVHCAGAACQAWDAEGNTFHLREIRVDQGKVVDVNHIDYVWKDDKGAYRRVEPRQAQRPPNVGGESSRGLIVQ